MATMNNYQIRLLSHMKKLIFNGKRRFENRNDRNYKNDLICIGITEEEAWYLILGLNCFDYLYDLKNFYMDNNPETLTFKKIINNKKVYIKLKLEKLNNDEMTVCLSFHIDFE